MALTPLLHKPHFMAECDRCRVVFDPYRGGVCARCGRMLCARHLVGESFVRRAAALFGFAPKECVECRGAGQAPARVA